MSKDADSLIKATLAQQLEIAMNALQFYKENTVYFYQSSTSDHGTECSDIAEIAINQIRHLKEKQ